MSHTILLRASHFRLSRNRLPSSPSFLRPPPTLPYTPNLPTMTIFSTYLSLFSAPLVDANSTNPSPTSTSASSPGGAADPYTPSPSAPSHSRKAGRASVDVSEPVELHAMSRPTRPGMMARATSSFRVCPATHSFCFILDHLRQSLTFPYLTYFIAHFTHIGYPSILLPRPIPSPSSSRSYGPRSSARCSGRVGGGLPSCP